MQTEADRIAYEQLRKKEVQLAKLFDAIPNPRIDEYTFRTVFLPMFAIGADLINVDAWRGVAGQLTNEVDVFRGEEYLFTVPPMVAETKTVISRRSNPNHMITTPTGRMLNEQNNRSGGTGSQLIEVEHRRKAMEYCNEQRLPILERWAEIFKRYGIDYIEERTKYAKEKGIDPKSIIPPEALVIANKSSPSISDETDATIKFDANTIDPY